MQGSPLAATSGREAFHQPSPPIDDPPAAIQQQVTVPTLQVALENPNRIPDVPTGMNLTVDPQAQLSDGINAVEQGTAADNSSLNETIIETIANSSTAGETTTQYVLPYPCKVINLTLYSAKAVYHHILRLHMSFIRKKTFVTHSWATCVLNPSLITYRPIRSSVRQSCQQMSTFVLTRAVSG